MPNFFAFPEEQKNSDNGLPFPKTFLQNRTSVFLLLDNLRVHVEVITFQFFPLKFVISFPAKSIMHFM